MTKIRKKLLWNMKFSNMTGLHNIPVLGLVIFLLPSFCVCLTCLLCTDSIAPRDCGRVKKCGAHEACYIDQYITASGYIRYNMGCRDTRFCNATAGRRAIKSTNIHQPEFSLKSDVNIRSTADVKTCTTCCNTDICNNGGCGATGYPSRQSRGPVCYACAQQTSPDTCDAITVCGKNSICKVKFKDHLGTGDVYYSSSCEDAQICHQDAEFNNVIAVGRRTLTEEVDTASHQCVVKCCDGDLCNGECGNGGTTLLSTSAPQTCIHNCVHGHCRHHGTDHTCHCDSGYTGERCDIQVVTSPPPSSHCSPTNCQHGTCHFSGSHWQCVCQPGFAGVHCGNVLHGCVSSPCVHGYCHNNGAGYKCTCQTGYAGQHCDQVHVAGCPTSYHQVQLSTGVIMCLELFHSGVRLSRAEEHCQNTNGGHLVTMDTAAKREAVKNFLAQRHELSQGPVVWIGLHWSSVYGWRWYSGVPISASDQFVTSFVSHVHMDHDHLCVGVGLQKHGDFKLTTRDCGSSHKYICEYP